jgi:hypothetical protein
LQLAQDTLGSQKSLTETLQKRSAELQDAIANLQEKRMEAREEIGRHAVRLERMPILEKENADLKIALETQRATNTSLISDLSAARAILAHLQDSSCRVQSTATGNATPSHDQRSPADPLSHTPIDGRPDSQEQLASALDDQVDAILASIIEVITESGPFTTKELHEVLRVRGILDPKQISVKKLVAQLRRMQLLTFDPETGTWNRRSPEKSSDVSTNGTKHEAT